MFNENRELSITRLLNAPIDLVWKVFTEPEHIKNWWGPSGFSNTISEMNVEPNGAWEFVMHSPDGTDYKNKHIYHEIVKHNKIVLDHVTAPKFRLTMTFEAQGDKTFLSWHSVFESAGQLQHVIKVFKANEGMKQNIQRLEEYLATL